MVSLLWHRFHPRPRSFHIPRLWPTNKQMNIQLKWHFFRENYLSSKSIIGLPTSSSGCATSFTFISSFLTSVLILLIPFYPRKLWATWGWESCFPHCCLSRLWYMHPEYLLHSFWIVHQCVIIWLSHSFLPPFSWIWWFLLFMSNRDSLNGPVVFNYSGPGTGPDTP